VEIRDRVVVITGASSGIGEATAVAFAQRGGKVVLAARRLERLEQLAGRIEEAGGSALALRCDVSDVDELDRLPGIVNELVGPTDVLVNSAGIPGGGEFANLTHEQIDKVVRVNLLGVMHASRAFLPGMLARGSGHIVNVASLAGRFAPPRSAVYSATKHGVVGFSESLSYEAADRGVLVTSVNPGFVATEGFPSDNIPPRLLLKMETVSNAIVKVVRDQIAPEYSIPRWIAPLQLFRILTPGPYRWGVRIIRGRAPATRAKD
jgi:hypothetical protein